MEKNYTLKKIFIATMLLAICSLSSIHVSAQATLDSIKETVDNHNDRISGIDERLLTTESDVAKHNKIKFSGYIQAQFMHDENATSDPGNYFMIRRARLKAAYEPIDGVAFVLQPDFIPGSVTIKDAYAQMNEPWLKMFSLWMGQFNRPNYEVEYSSSQREVPERSRIIRALYPGERALGAKIEMNPSKLPLKVQLALFNGNDGLTVKDATGTNINPTNKDLDNFKDIMARVTYSFKLGSLGSLDLGAHLYNGSIKATSTNSLKSDYTLDTDVKLGDALKKSWIGGELQFYADILGGMAIKGEYIVGTNALPGYIGTSTTSATTNTVKNDSLTILTTNTTTKTIQPNITKDFSGYYVYFIKNIGKKHQFAVRYDVYDPNTKLNADEIGVKKYDVTTTSSTTTSKSTTGVPTIINSTKTTSTTKTSLKSGKDDIAYQSITLAWQYYFNDNIRVTLAYEMSLNEKVGVNATTNIGNVTSSATVDGVPMVNDYSKAFDQNVLTLRVQAKF